MTIDELGAMIAKEFTRIAGEFTHMHEQFAYMHTEFGNIHGRFDRLETRVIHVEEISEDTTGRLIGIDDQLSRVEYRLEDVERTLKDSPPFKLKKRIEKLEKQTFGAIQPA